MPKKSDMKFVSDGLYQLSKEAYYIECSISNKLCYCPRQRLLELQKGDYKDGFKAYVCRDVSRLMKHGYTLESLKKMGKKEMIAESQKILEHGKAVKKDKAELKQLDKEIKIKEKIEDEQISLDERVFNNLRSHGHSEIAVPTALVPEIIKMLKIACKVNQTKIV